MDERHHHHHHDLSGTRLMIAIVLNLLITIAQFVGGIVSGSLALLGDALHNFSDVTALFISWAAHRISHKDPDKQSTFGYRRAGIIAALFNASALIVIGLYLIYVSIMRLIDPEPVLSGWVIAMGIAGIIVNGGSIWMLEADAHGNMNIRAAYLHLIGDVLTSVAVVVGGVAIAFWQIYWIDPLVSILIALYLITASVGLIRESTAILMQFTPASVDLDDVQKALTQMPGICGVHHVHLWCLDDHRIHLEAHLDFNEDVTLSVASNTIGQLERMLEIRFNIRHTTFQCEYDRCDDKALLAHH